MHDVFVNFTPAHMCVTTPRLCTTEISNFVQQQQKAGRDHFVYFYYRRGHIHTPIVDRARVINMNQSPNFGFELNAFGRSPFMQIIKKRDLIERQYFTAAAHQKHPCMYRWFFYTFNVCVCRYATSKI